MIGEFLKGLSQFQMALVIVFMTGFLIQLFHFLFFQLRLILFKPRTNPTELVPVSIVICAKNEYENLLQNMPLILEQDYPNYEVVVVNDSSWDNSEDVLKALESKYAHLKVLKLNEDIQRMTGKKFALTMGIKAAKNDVLLLTDADCNPNSKEWIKQMIIQRGDRNIGLGVSLLKKGSGLLKNLFRFESVQTAINYSSASLVGFTYMGVGRNLMYDKNLFFQVGGFRKHMHVLGGDDDLFINEIATKKNTAMAISPESQTCSDSANKFKEWWVQKKRHIYASNFYKKKHKLLLGIEPLGWWLMWLSLITLLILHTPCFLLLAVISLRYLFVSATFIAISRKWNALDAVVLWPFWEAFLNVMKPMVLISNKISKPKKWRM